MSLVYRAVGILAIAAGIYVATQGRTGMAVWNLLLGLFLYGAGWYRDHLTRRDHGSR